jgi:phage host-nuclease inhibitor protein Gam
MGHTDPYVAKMEAQLKEWKAKIDGIKAKAQKASAEGRAELQKHVAAFETRYGEVSRRFDELRTAGEDKASAIKVRLENAWNAFKAEFEKKQF